MDIDTYKILGSWAEVGSVSPQNENEAALVDNLRKRGYLVENDEEERGLKEGVLSRLREA
jgi:hypothetical protein